MTAGRDAIGLRASLASARDAQITKVVAMVDAMPQRGAADDLIAPLRPRLAQLRPARPLSFTRLLFIPLDPVIVPSREWRFGDAGVPRSALSPIACAIEAAEPSLKEAMTPGLAIPGPDDRGAVIAAGSVIWPRAAMLLQQLQVPGDWEARTGLPTAYFQPLTLTVSAVLHEAADIKRVVANRRMPDDDWVRGLLARTAARQPSAVPTLIAVLLAKLPTPSRVLAIASEASSDRPRQGIETALDHTLARLRDMLNQASAESLSEPCDLAQAALDTAKIATLLMSLGDSAAGRPSRRREIEHIRRTADAQCRARFAAALSDTLETAVTARDPDDPAIAALEASARDLRRLEAAGRALGSGEHFDVLLHGASAKFRGAATGLSLVDRARMVEILSGADEAMALLASDTASIC